MHELSIAMSIVDTVTATVPNESVAVVHVRVGDFSGVVPEALEFAWSPATQNTRLDGSRLQIDRVAAAAWCDNCGVEFDVSGYKMKCPTCGDASEHVVRGKELEILSVEVRDEDEAGRGPHADSQEERRIGAQPA